MIPLTGRNRISLSRTQGYVNLSEGYFFAAVQDSGANEMEGVDTAVDSTGNVYALGNHLGPIGNFNENYYIAKYTRAGVFLDDLEIGQYPLPPSPTQMYNARCIRMHPDGNLIFGGLGEYFSANDYINVFKISTALSIVWQTRTQPNSLLSGAQGLAIQSNGNIVTCGTPQSSESKIVQYDTSGTLTSARVINYGYGGTDIVVDPSDNNVSCSRYTAGGVNGAAIVWLDSSLNLIRFRYLTNPIYCDANAITCDASGNIYVTGRSYESGVISAYVAKYDSAGTLQYVKAIQNSFPDSLVSTGIAVQSNGTIYVLGYGPRSGSDALILVKLDTNGNFIFSRQISVVLYNCQSARVRLDAANNVYISGFIGIAGDKSMFTAKVPNDGSKTGTYTLLGTAVNYQVASPISVGLSTTVAGSNSNTVSTPTTPSAGTARTSGNPTFSYDTVVL